MYEVYNSARKAYELVISGGHTEELQEEVCKDPYFAYYFARYVKWADIGYCQKAACKDPYWAYLFARDVKGADLEVCLEVVRGTEWEDEVRKLVIEGGLG
jgi:hypothetical protein